MTVFTVKTAPELGLSEIYLDDDAAEHIRRGHRELSTVLNSAVKTAAEAPTRIYSSVTHSNRMQFLSDDVTTPRGNPMMVVIERDENRGRVITATPKKNISGDLLWESSNNIYTNYDASSDILYFSKGASRVAVADEADGILFRTAEDDGEHLGVTIFDARASWAVKRDEMIRIIADFLSLTLSEVGLRTVRLF